MFSTFPGIDLLGRAFAAEGNCVVRGGDVIYGQDVRDEHYPPGVFQGVIGGPPCQSFSSLAHLVRANGHESKFGNLIPEFERIAAETECDWFLMENVRQAPVPVVPGYWVKDFLLDNSMISGADGWGQEQRRWRRFSFGLRGRPLCTCGYCAPCHEAAMAGTFENRRGVIVPPDNVPDLRRWIDLATFVLPDAEVDPKNVDAGGSASDPRTRRQAVNAGHDDPNVSLTQARRTRRQAVPSAVQAGKVKQTRYRLADALHLQGLPPGFLDHCPWTAEGKLKAVANGVPMWMGRAVAKAVRCALELGARNEERTRRLG